HAISSYYELVDEVNALCEHRRRLENQGRQERARIAALEAETASLRTELEQLRAENQGVWAIHGEDMARAEELKAENGMLRAKLLNVEAVPSQPPPPPPPPALPPVPQMSMDQAAAEGDLDVLHAWLKTTGPLEYTSNALDDASSNGYLYVLKWWHAQCDPRMRMLYTERAIEGASARGDNTTLSWWKSMCGDNMPWSHHALNLAIMNGHIKTVKWWEHSSGRTLWPSLQAIEEATRCNDTAMLALLSKIYDLSDLDLVPRNPIVLARKNDARDAAEWWLEYPGVPVAENALHALSLLGDTAMVYDLVQKFGRGHFDLQLVSRNLHQYSAGTADWWRDTYWLL
ncbi:hypothetical protein H9P43_009055, partial [Blastocladiella emersonii ATCC 22665]